MGKKRKKKHIMKKTRDKRQKNDREDTHEGGRWEPM